MLACAQAGTFLQEFVGLKTLLCADLIVPTVYPLCLQELDITLDTMSAHFSQLPGAGRVADALMLNLAHLPHLSRLTLNLGAAAILSTVGQLPELQCLIIDVHLGGRAEMDLSWLHLQPCSKLCLGMIISGSFEVQQSVVRQLQGLQVHSLHLDFADGYTLERQRLWHTVSAVEQMGLYLSGLEGILNMVPAGPELYIECWDVGREPLQISWHALLAGTDRTIIDVATVETLSICSPGSSADAQLLGRPWQLMTVNAAEECLGLPPPLASKEGTYFWQNRLAVLAGWLQRD